MKRIIYIAIALLYMQAAGAQRPAERARTSDAVQKEIRQKVKSMLSTLAWKDPEREKKAESILIGQLTTVRNLQAAYDRTFKFANDSMNEAKREHVLLNIGNRRLAGLYKAHFIFDAELHAYLTAHEVEQVKEIMTGNELTERYKALETKHPSLTEQQKKYALEMLKAAREQALDMIYETDKRRCFEDMQQEIERHLDHRADSTDR